MRFRIFIEDTYMEYAFELPEIPKGADCAPWDTDFAEEDNFLNFTAALEQYGVLDWDGLGDAYLGYTSPELKDSDAPLVIDEFRKFFIKRGYKAGPVVARHLTDWDGTPLV